MGDNTRLKKLRMQRCLSQRELAEAISIDRSMISLYENDRREIPTSTAKLFADFFNVSVDYLLGKDSINSGDINTKETARDSINKQLTLLNVEEQNRLIGYIDGILDSKKGK